MPIFEYKCRECGTKYEVLHKSSENQNDIICPKCSSSNNKKLLSTFSASMGDSGYSGNSCATGNCDVPSSGGCASGFCGLN
ncbi:MAG: zinc ribbon domain-containing protein [Ignavibacteriaceae bacterium]